MAKPTDRMFFTWRDGRYVLTSPPARTPTQVAKGRGPQTVRQRAKNLLEGGARIDLVRAAGMACTYCKRVGELMLDPDGVKWHMDHVIPLSRGGSPELHNVAVACARCNMAKGNRTLEQWLADADSA